MFGAGDTICLHYRAVGRGRGSSKARTLLTTRLRGRVYRSSATGPDEALGEKSATLNLRSDVVESERLVF